MQRMKSVLLIFLVFLLSQPSYALSSDRMATIEHIWPNKMLFDHLSFFQQITHASDSRSTYFWGNQFQFQNGKNGYIGFSKKDTHTIHFSIENALGWKEGKCKNVTKKSLRVRCAVSLPWKIGRRYQFDISKSSNLVTATVTDLIAKKTIKIGTIAVPNTFGKFYKSLSFVKHHTRGKKELLSCFALGAQSSIFLNPTGNNTIKARLKASHQGRCDDPYVVQTFCQIDSCINNINDLGGLPSPKAPKLIIANKKDLLAQTLLNTLKKEEMIAVRLQDNHWAPKIFFPPAGPLENKLIFVDNQAPYDTFLDIDGTTQKIIKGQQIMYISDGKRWKIMQHR
ncbi:hypothetical protein [Bartonella machadoae]|uniref:hypothetical protein n=1 Tax=Bartonella machadoae TaxID=2893471 RepID=UPI001F4D0218|nr:hypothetical protein [Bartonella machadoae]UNE53851.1 hypothetical protein LNM86_09640 [Bartonella machadoae]